MWCGSDQTDGDTLSTVLAQLTTHQFAVDHTGKILIKRLIADFTLFRSDGSDLVVEVGQGGVSRLPVYCKAHRVRGERECGGLYTGTLPVQHVQCLG